MRIANEVKHAVHRVEVTIEQARAKLASFFSRDAELRRVIASEFPMQRRANDLKQRNAEKFWKMQYAGRPGRDPQFRLEERVILQKVFEKGLNREEVAMGFIPLWKHYHAKYAAEHPARSETEAQLRKTAAMYREAAGPNILIPAEYRDVEGRRRVPFLGKPGGGPLQLIRQGLRNAKTGKRVSKSGSKGQGLGF